MYRMLLLKIIKSQISEITFLVPSQFHFHHNIQKFTYERVSSNVSFPKKVNKKHEKELPSKARIAQFPNDTNQFIHLLFSSESFDH